MTAALQVIICSTRPGRVGPAVARWFERFAREHGRFAVALVDIAAFNLPVYDEALFIPPPEPTPGRAAEPRNPCHLSEGQTPGRAPCLLWRTTPARRQADGPALR